ncbi:MAG: tryptophan synthase subunit alpha [bacterium]
MKRIEKTFIRTRSEGRTAFIPFITAGDPDLSTTLQLLFCLSDAGADLIELGVPFSDPMADGPTIQAASERALKNDFGIAEVLEVVARFREGRDTPVVLFGYYNPVFSYGEERLSSEAQEAGVDGFLLVDLPPEEGSNMRSLARAAGMEVIYLVAPTTPDDRLEEICRVAGGFIYYVCVTGVTGARTEVSTTIAADVKRIKKLSDLPVAVGFGISTPEQAARVAEHADAVVVGSAIVSVIGKHGDSPRLVDEVREFAGSLATGVRQVRKPGLQ